MPTRWERVKIGRPLLQLSAARIHPERIILAGSRFHHGHSTIGVDLSKTTIRMIGLSADGLEHPAGSYKGRTGQFDLRFTNVFVHRDGPVDRQASSSKDTEWVITTER